MATSKKTNSGRKTPSTKARTGAGSSGRKRTNTRKTTNNTKASNLLRNEIKLIILLAVTVLFELSAFGLGGILGEYLGYFLFGMVGLIGYIFPVILFAGVTYLILNISEKKAVFKFVIGIITILFIASLIQLIFNMDEQTNVSDLYFECAEAKNGGGITGGLIAFGLFSAVGKIGAYFIDIIVIIIMLILLTEKSLFNGVKEGSRKVYERTSEDIERFKESSEERQLEKERIREQKQLEKDKKKRVDNVVKGVPLNVVLNEKDSVNDDMKEITLEDIYVSENSDITEEKFEDKKGFIFKHSESHEDDMREIHIEEIEEPEIKEEIKPEKITPKDIEEVELDTSVDDSNYKYPPKSLLMKPATGKKGKSNQELSETAAKLQQVLANFGVKVTITDVSMGPSVTRYELQPEMGTKVSKITSLADDIKLNLAAADIRIEAPIPGKAAVGIEVPNIGREPVLLRELLDAPELKNHPSKLAFASGKDIGGKVVVADIAKMPHMLVAGTTGSGKSVFMNSIIMTILYRAKPSEVRMLIIDPKVVEFGIYNDIPHLLHPVITDPKNAASALNWAVAEMTRRYQLLAENNVRDFQSYNKKVEQIKPEDGEAIPEKMPQIIIVIDELADLMMVAAKAVEESICRLAQLARAAGIHLIIATQRPSVDVVTGLIKANVPARVALLVSSGTDSRTIIDMNGAEKLLGNGDMLFYPSGYVKPVRVQGAFVSEGEVANVVEFLKNASNTSTYDESISEHLTVNSNLTSGASSNSSDDAKDNGRDQYFADAGRLVIEMDKASSSMLQRRFRIGFNRAARIIDELYEQGVIGPEEGSKPRKVVMLAEDFEQLLNEQ